MNEITEEQVTALVVEAGHGSLSRAKAREILVSRAKSADVEAGESSNGGPKLSVLKGAATRAAKALEAAEAYYAKSRKAAEKKPDDKALAEAAEAARIAAETAAITANEALVAVGAFSE